MELTALKSGLFAHPDPARPHIRLTKGQPVEVDERLAHELMGSGWAGVEAHPTPAPETAPTADAAPEPGPEPAKSLLDMTKDELNDHAVSVGMEPFHRSVKHADRVAAIEAHYVG